MERRMAEVVVMKLGKENGPQLSVEEAMSMTKIKTDAYFSTDTLINGILEIMLSSKSYSSITFS